VFCIHCGKAGNPTDRFCTHCGAEFPGELTAVPTAIDDEPLPPAFKRFEMTALVVAAFIAIFGAGSLIVALVRGVASGPTATGPTSSVAVVEKPKPSEAQSLSAQSQLGLKAQASLDSSEAPSITLEQSVELTLGESRADATTAVSRSYDETPNGPEQVTLSLKGGDVNPFGFAAVLRFTDGRLSYVAKNLTPREGEKQSVALALRIATASELLVRQGGTCMVTVKRDVQQLELQAHATVISCGRHSLRLTVVSGNGEPSVGLIETLGPEPK
jgi:hypothetical protein